MRNNQKSSFWDHACQAKGHTGYSDPLLHRYDQPVRLATVGRILSRLFPVGLEDKAALDIGCGTGDFVALLRTRKARVTGVDISPEVIRGTERRFANDRQVSLLTGAILDLDLPPDALDVITSVTVLQHVVNDGEFVRSLQALRFALRSDGRMIFLELAPPHAAPVEITDNTGYVYRLERPPGHWQAAFVQAGLCIIDTPVFPQFGIALLRGLSWLINRLRPSRPQAGTEVAVAEADEGGRVLRRFQRAAFRGMRRSLLFFAWPIDYIFHLPLPARFCHYRIFVVATNPEATHTN